MDERARRSRAARQVQAEVTASVPEMVELVDALAARNLDAQLTYGRGRWHVVVTLSEDDPGAALLDLMALLEASLAEWEASLLTLQVGGRTYTVGRVGGTGRLRAAS